MRHIPFGAIRWENGQDSTGQEWDFTAQRLERGFGLLDYRARMYDPVIGRFVSADTVVPDFGNPQDLNRYSYVRGNPVKFTDPTGHYTFEDEPDDPYIWYQDKPEEYKQTQIRGANWDSFVMWEETQAPDIPFIDTSDVELPDAGTFSLGVSGAAFFVVGVRGGFGIAIDTNGDMVVYLGIGGGGYTAMGFNKLGPNVMVTNAPSVDKLKDWAIQFGGQIGEFASAGAEWVIIPDNEGNIFHGVNIAGGAAFMFPFPGELHLTGEHDWMLCCINIEQLNPVASDGTTYEFDYQSVR